MQVSPIFPLSAHSEQVYRARGILGSIHRGGNEPRSPFSLGGGTGSSCAITEVSARPLSVWVDSDGCGVKHDRQRRSRRVIRGRC